MTLQGFHTFIVKLGNNYTGLSLTAQQTNRKRTEPEGVGAVPAHARGEGREVRERERQKRQKSLQINGIVLAAPGVGMVWGRGPSREERGGGKWHEPRETRPRSGQLTRPNPPSPTLPPDTRERHGPPPRSGDYNMAKAKMKNKQLPSAGADKNLVTGDHIPTPQDLPQRKSSLVTSKLAGGQVE